MFFLLAVDNYLPISIESMVQNIFTCSFAIFFICGVLPWFAMPLLLFGALFFFVSKLFRWALPSVFCAPCARILNL